jgi:hypothetical protein
MIHEVGGGASTGAAAASSRPWVKIMARRLLATAPPLAPASSLSTWFKILRAAVGRRPAQPGPSATPGRRVGCDDAAGRGELRDVADGSLDAGERYANLLTCELVGVNLLILRIALGPV